MFIYRAQYVKLIIIRKLNKDIIPEKVFSYNQIFHTQFAKQNKRHQQQYFFAKTLSSVFDFYTRIA